MGLKKIFKSASAPLKAAIAPVKTAVKLTSQAVTTATGSVGAIGSAGLGKVGGLVQNNAGTIADAGLAYATGGASLMGGGGMMDMFGGFLGGSKQPVMAPQSYQEPLQSSSTPSPASPIYVPAPQQGGNKMGLILGIGGGAVVLILLMVMMMGRK